jgi:hypothetical protein
MLQQPAALFVAELVGGDAVPILGLFHAEFGRKVFHALLTILPVGPVAFRYIGEQPRSPRSVGQHRAKEPVTGTVVVVQQHVPAARRHEVASASAVPLILRWVSQLCAEVVKKQALISRVVLRTGPLESCEIVVLKCQASPGRPRPGHALPAPTTPWRTSSPHPPTTGPHGRQLP